VAGLILYVAPCTCSNKKYVFSPAWLPTLTSKSSPSPLDLFVAVDKNLVGAVNGLMDTTAGIYGFYIFNLLRFTKISLIYKTMIYNMEYQWDSYYS